MNEREIKLLKARAKKYSTIITEQHKVKKDKRDYTLIKDARDRLDKINMWLMPVKEKVVVPRMTKEEFKEIMNVPKSKDEMTIDTIEELKNAWPNIRGKNIQIKAPRHVLYAAKQLAKQDFKGRS